MMSKRVYALSPSEQEAASRSLSLERSETARGFQPLERAEPLRPEHVAMIQEWLR
jgi:hypothetical protein